MDRSKFKRKHPYNHQGYEKMNNPWLKNCRSRYNREHQISHRSRSPEFSRSAESPNEVVAVSYRILCPVTRTRRGMVEILDSIGRETGARIHVPPLIRGDRERVIEITGFQLRRGGSDTFSPAQKALFMVHDWIVEEDDGDRDVTTWLVVEQGVIGSVLGYRGNIVQQLRRDTRADILLLENHFVPRCLTMSEELIQIRGQVDDVKSAVVLISLLLRGRQLRDDCKQRMLRQEGLLHNDCEQQGLRMRDLVSLHDDEIDGGSCSDGFNGHSNRVVEFKPIEFLIIYPNDKVDRLIRETGSIMEMLRNDNLVDVRIVDLETGTREKVIIISSTEYTEEELFPSQEALLHIHSQIVDIDSDIITTRLLVPCREIKGLRTLGGWSKVTRLSGVDVHILPREQNPLTVFPTYDIVQIVGKISAARDALVAVTSLRRDYLYHNSLLPEDLRPLSNPLLGEAREAGSTDRSRNYNFGS